MTIHTQRNSLHARIVSLVLAFILCIAISPSAFAAQKSSNIADGQYYIGTKAGNWFDIKGGGISNGDIAQIWDNANQTFTLTRLSDGTYKITVDHSGKAIEVSNSDHNEGARVQQWEFLDSYNCKRWYIVDCGGGWVKFINKESGLVLDIEGGNDRSGVRLQQWKNNDSDAQHFRLVPVPQLDNSQQKEPNTNTINIKIGDVVQLNGNYYESSSGGKLGKYTLGTYIIRKISPGATYPYGIGPVDKSWIDGWTNDTSLLVLSSQAQTATTSNDNLWGYQVGDIVFAREINKLYSLPNEGAILSSKGVPSDYYRIEDTANNYRRLSRLSDGEVVGWLAVNDIVRTTSPIGGYRFVYDISPERVTVRLVEDVAKTIAAQRIYAHEIADYIFWAYEQLYNSTISVDRSHLAYEIAGHAIVAQPSCYLSNKQFNIIGVSESFYNFLCYHTDRADCGINSADTDSWGAILVAKFSYGEINLSDLINILSKMN